MDRQLPKATPALAKSLWERQKRPSARAVAISLSQSGRPVHFTTVNRWRRQRWRTVASNHPLETAWVALDKAIPLVTADPTTTAEDFVAASPDRKRLAELTDGELLHTAARDLLIAICLVANTLLRQQTVISTRTGAVAILFRALTDGLIAATTAFAEALRMGPQSPQVWK